MHCRSHWNVPQITQATVTVTSKQSGKVAPQKQCDVTVPLKVHVLSTRLLHTRHVLFIVMDRINTISPRSLYSVFESYLCRATNLYSTNLEMSDSSSTLPAVASQGPVLSHWQGVRCRAHYIALVMQVPQIYFNYLSYINGGTISR